MDKETWVVLVWRKDERGFHKASCDPKEWLPSFQAEWPEVLGVYPSEGEANAAINLFRMKDGCGADKFDILLS